MEVHKIKLYPSTPRLGTEGSVEITEKLDGLNLAFFKLAGVLYVATRNNVVKASYLEYRENQKEIESGHLIHKFINDNNYLKELNDNTIVFGEFVGENRNYRHSAIWMMFAKGIVSRANTLDFDLDVSNIVYTVGNHKYAFEDGERPDWAASVPFVATTDEFPTIEEMDRLYEAYTDMMDGYVEGFIINFNNTIFKYVRTERGKLVDHRFNLKKVI